MSITTKILSNSLIGLVSVLPALLVMPAMAGDPYAPPYVGANDYAFVFGDVAVTGDNGTVIDNMAVGGRRMEQNGAGKYLNAFPGYNMYGRSLSVAVPTTENATNVLYVGPVNLTLGSVADKDFRYNFQKDIDTDGVNDDIDIATYGANSSNPIVWNEELNSLVTKVANITESASDAQMSAGGVYMYSRLDTANHEEGSLTLAKTIATIDGAKVIAGAISVTDGSTLTISKDAAIALDGAERLYTTAEAINSDGATVFNADTISLNESQIVVDPGASLTIDTTSGATFANSSAENGGAIYIGAAYINDVGTFQGSATIDSSDVSVFDNNTATNQGGAIYNYGTLNIDNAVFTRNKTTSMLFPSQGGAIFNSGDYDYLDAPSITATISNTTFGDKNDATKGNQAVQGGAIANENDLIDGEVTLNDVNFYYNKAFASDNNESSLGGAIWNEAIMTINGDTEFKGNTAEGYNVEGGAIYNSGTLTFNDEVLFDSNTSTDVHSGNGAFGGALSTGWTSDTLFKKQATFIGNKALSTEEKGTQGGAIFNGNVVTFEDGAIFSQNEAVYGGAVFNDEGFMTINDGSFTNNKAGDEGGAIFNYDGTVEINAVDNNVVFSGNTANGVVNDITNYFGDINFDAAAGKSITLNGIDGLSGTINKTGAGLLSVSEYIAKQSVNVDAGELHLTTGEGNLYQSTVNVASGATINTIDNLINDYVGKITLSDGALVKGDLDYAAGLADTYSAADDATITYKLANALGLDIQYGATKAIKVAEGNNVTVNDGGFAWYADADHGLALTGGTAGTGTVNVTGTAGGIDAAVDVTDTSSQQEVSYALTAASETFTGSGGSDNVIEKADFSITGNGSDADNDNKLVLASNLVVDEDSSLTLTDVVMEQAGTTEKIDMAEGATLTADNAHIAVDVDNSGSATLTATTLAAGNTFTNQLGAVLRILDSDVHSTITNFGTLISDPTTYYATVDNSGSASFEGDTFESTAVLNNTGTADLMQDGLGNDVEFVAGSSITGGGLINLVSGTTHFNDTASSNTIKVASGADFDGTLVSSGTLDTRNAGIDAITGSINGGSLFVDASLTGAGAIDTFGGLSNTTTIRGITLTDSSYGTNRYYEFNIGDALVDGNIVVDGATNYFTKIARVNDKLLFSDKLMNTSGMYAQLGSWAAGNNLSASTAYDSTTDSYSTTQGQTVGQALTALDTAIGNRNYVTSGYTGSLLSNGQSVAASILAIANQTDVNTTDIAGKQAQLMNNAGTPAAISSTVLTSINMTPASASDTALVTEKAISTALNTKLDATTALSTYAALVGGNTLNGAQVITNVTNAGGAGVSALTVTATDTDASNGSSATLAVNSQGVSVTGGLTTDTLATTGDATIGGNLETTGNATVHGNATIDGTLTAGQTTISKVAADDSATTAMTVTAGNTEATHTLVVSTAGVTVDGNAVLTSASALDASNIADGAIAEAKLATGVQTKLSHAEDAYAAAVTNKTDNVESGNANLVTSKGVYTNAKNAAYNTVATSNIGANSTIGVAISNLDDAIGTTTTGNYVQATNSVGVNLGALDTAVKANADKIGDVDYSDEGPVAGSFLSIGGGAGTTTVRGALDTLDGAVNLSTLTGSHVTAGASIAQNLDQLSLAIDNATSQANVYTDERVESLDKNLSAGVAGAVALSSVAVSGVERGEVSVGAGYGYFNGQSAAAFGAAMGLSNRWSVNAGAGISNSDVSFRAGTNYKFKLF